MSYLCASPWIYVVILMMFVLKFTCCPHVHFFCFVRLFLSHPSIFISEKGDTSPETGKFHVFRVEHMHAQYLHEN